MFEAFGVRGLRARLPAAVPEPSSGLSTGAAVGPVDTDGTTHARVSRRPGPRAAQAIAGYAELLRAVQAAGLMTRRRRWYAIRLAAAAAALAAVVMAVAVVGDSWWALLPAAVLAVVLTQVAFLGHDCCHRQVFTSHAVNEWTSRVLSSLVGGLSYGWWMSKHTRHHSGPNQEGRDPDIAPGVVAFTPAVAAAKRGFAARAVRTQGWWFFPLLLLEGLNLHVASVRDVLGRHRPALAHRWVDVTFLAIRLLGYPVLLLMVLSPGKAAGFLGVQLAVFGLLLGGAFAPNHTGMPIVPANTRVDFLHRQVVMSRNISGGVVVDFLMGGLNRQIEHHLFPSMPRPHLRLAQPYVRAHCHRHGITYTEATLPGAYRQIVVYLNRVGLTARDPFTCPLLTQYRG